MKETLEADGTAARTFQGATMFPVSRILIACSACFLFSTQFLNAQTKIEFDVPAIVGAREVTPAPFGGDKLIEIVLPISTSIDSTRRSDIEEFRFDVSWNRSVYGIYDYGPKTQTTTEISGLKAIEKTASKSASFNLNLNSKPFELTSANLASDVGGNNSRRESYQEIPQHEVLVASGTIDRGTGAFFRFHRSRTNTLEGSQNLILSYRVPANWQNGILTVECRGYGKRKVVGLWNEPIEIGRAFVVPVYLENSTSAQKLAIDFAKAEQELQKAWLGFESRMKNAKPFEFAVTRCSSGLPDKWPHLLIQSGEDRYLSEFEGYLTQEVAVSAGKFVQARNSLEPN